MLPAINLTQIVRPNIVLFGSSLLQLRSRDYFQGAKREIDPFWSWGFLYRRGQWNFTATSTYVANFRKRTAIPPINNQSMICDFELSRPISSRAPGVVTFIRAEPVWNWGEQEDAPPQGSKPKETSEVYPALSTTPHGMLSLSLTPASAIHGELSPDS